MTYKDFNAIVLIVLIYGATALIGYMLLVSPAFQTPDATPVRTETPASTAPTPSAVNLDGVSGFLFSCADGKSLKADFEGRGVHLVLSDGRSLSLPRAISADGARYANPDESFVFWNKGNGAFVQEYDQTTYANCVTTQ